MTEKRFKVHSMIRGMNIGETMDLEVCEELIKKYGSSSDIDLLITNNGNNMTYKEVADLLNENEQLKQRITTQSVDREQLCKRIDEVRKENEQLKQFKEDVFNKIDMHLRMLPTARDNVNGEYSDPSLYEGAIYMLETLKKELQE